MSDDDAKVGRRSTDADLAVVIERLDTIDDRLEDIHTQTVKTNGRVSELEVKERIRQDREEQRAILSAASEAAKYRVEQANEQQAAKTVDEHRFKLTVRIMLIAAVVGGVAGSLGEAARLIFG